MKKILNRVVAACLLFCVLFSTAGCWDLNELDTISIVTGVGIDVDEENENDIKLSLQIEKPEAGGSSSLGKSGGGGSERSYVTVGKAESITQASEKIYLQNSRKPFFHHNQVVIIGRELAEKGIKEHIDIFLRSNQMRMEVYVVVADGTANEILEAQVNPEIMSAIALSRIIDSFRKYSDEFLVSLLTFVSKYIEDETSPVLPMFKLTGEKDKQQLEFAGMALFENDKMVGEIDEEQSMQCVWFGKKVHLREIEIHEEGGCANVGIMNAKSKITTIFEGDKPSIEMKIKGKIKLTEVQGFDDMTIMESIERIETLSNKKVEEEARQLYEESQKLRLDFLGLGEKFYQHHPKKWRQMKNNWKEIFSEMPIKITAELTIVDPGKITESMHMKDNK